MNSGSWASYRAAGSLGDDYGVDDGLRYPRRGFYRERPVQRTRKAHPCLSCNHEIPAGTPATYLAWLPDDYEPFTHGYLCPRAWACAYEPETDHERVPDDGNYPF